MTQHLYVDTAATAGGDGTTRAHSGANAAFASLNAAIAALPQPFTDDIHIHCAGGEDVSSANTTNFDFGGFALYLKGDLGEDHSAEGGDDGALFDNDGFYDGTLLWSTNHHHIVDASNRPIITNQLVHVIGMQVQGDKQSRECIRFQTASGEHHIVERNRIRQSNAWFAGIQLNATNHGATIRNNIIWKDTDGNTTSTAIVAGAGASGNTYHIYNNTITGPDVANSSAGITPNGTDTAGATYNIYNNVFQDLDSGYIDNMLTLVNATVNHDHNAVDSATTISGETNGVAMGTDTTDDMVDPKNATQTSYDMRPAAGSPLLAAGRSQTEDANVPAVDILGVARLDGYEDIGAFQITTAGATLAAGNFTSPVADNALSGKNITITLEPGRTWIPD